MLEISVYSIIDSNVFGVKIGGNFPFAIVKYKLVVWIRQINSITKKMQFDYASSKNRVKRKRLKEWTKIKNNLN
jgi:hypothetical protein